MSDDLVAYARTRDPQLREALAVRHLPLVKFVARKMSRSLPAHIELDDLVSWGSFGLIDAIDKFDPDRARFSTYAVTRIRGAILDGLQQMDWAPKQVTSRVRAVRKVRELLTNELGQEPSVAQLALHMDLTEAEVTRHLVDANLTRVRTLDGGGVGRESGHGDDIALARDAQQEIAGEIADIAGFVVKAVHCLGPRERAVFLLYYRDSLTLREIAERLGVSVSSATQAHTRLVEQIRERLVDLGGVA